MLQSARLFLRRRAWDRPSFFVACPCLNALANTALHFHHSAGVKLTRLAYHHHASASVPDAKSKFMPHLPYRAYYFGVRGILHRRFWKYKDRVQRVRGLVIQGVDAPSVLVSTLDIPLFCRYLYTSTSSPACTLRALLAALESLAMFANAASRSESRWRNSRRYSWHSRLKVGLAERGAISRIIRYAAQNHAVHLVGLRRSLVRSRLRERCIGGSLLGVVGYFFEASCLHHSAS